MKVYLPVFLGLFMPLILSAQRFGPELDSIAIYSLTSKSGVLYAGIDNELRIALPQSINLLFFETNNGIIFDDNSIIIIPQRPGTARIEVFIMEDNQKKIIGHRNFTVLSVPEPKLKIGTAIIENYKPVSIETLLLSDSLSIFFNDDIKESPQWYSIREYTIGYNYGGYYVTRNTIGNKFDLGTKTMITKIGTNEYLSISAIIESKSFVVKTLPLIKILIY